ncbi:unnamed protein product, partial [Vitis vinifera]|uniref:Uncharacterized protein n=1 Tax=Vitis vinifera TaxID=29760 RepID=D7SUG6_VITVI
MVGEKSVVCHQLNYPYASRSFGDSLHRSDGINSLVLISLVQFGSFFREQ